MYRKRPLQGILVLLALLGLLAVGPVDRAAAGELEETSIRLIPADAAFYNSMLRAGEQIEIIAKSNAWKKIMEMPSVQMGLGILEEKLEDESDPKAAQAKAMLANPQIKNGLALLGDMFSNDVFIYGNAEMADTLELLQDVSNAMSYGSIYFTATGEGDAMSPEEMQGKAVLYALVENVDKITVPTMLMGFAVEKEDLAREYLGMLKGTLGLVPLMVPNFPGKIDTQPVGDDDFLTITLQGEAIPWDEVPLDDFREFETNDGDVDKIVEHVKQLELVIAVGIHEGYLMIAVTDSLDSLAKLGEGETLLSRPELAVVKKYADERLTGIGYVSDDFMKQVAFSADDVDRFAEIGSAAVEKLSIDDDAKERIRTDIDALAADLKLIIPEAGAAVSFSFLTDGGIESYSHNWTENYRLDGSKPLDLLPHLGGDPLLAVTWREHVYPKAYDRLAHWIRVGHGYFEEFGLPEMNKKDRKKYLKVVKAVRPLCQELGRVNRENLIPACDGQSAIVLDAKLLSDQIVKEMPKTDQPMPMPELAVVIGIKDADAMRKAYVGYQAFFNDLLEVVREFDEDGKIPPGYEIPWPEAADTSDRSVLTYTLPERWGVDPRIKPNAVLTDNLAVVTASEAHSARLLEPTAPAVGGVLADAGRPRAVAVVFNWAGTLEALKPWIKLAATEAAKENLGVDVDDPQVAGILSQVDTVIEVLSAVRGCTVECYFEDGAMVTHGFMEVKDVE